MSNISNQNLFDLYKNGTQQDIDLITNVGIRWICASLGSISNFCLVYVTLKNKSLRSACNILIALDSLYAGIYELSVTITFLVVLSGINFIPLRNCLPLQMLPLLGFFLSQGGMLFIALDRLLCVLAPIWIHKNQKMHKKVLVPGMFCACAFYALWAIFLCRDISLAQGNKSVQCGTGDCFPDEVGAILNRNQLILMGITVACYPVILGIVMKRKMGGTGASKSVSYTRQMFKSLLAIVLVLLVGQCLSSITRMVGLNPSNATSGIEFLVANGQVCFKYLVYGSNAPILFALSSEYRKALKNVFIGSENGGGIFNIVHSSTQASHTVRKAGTNPNALPPLNNQLFNPNRPF